MTTTQKTTNSHQTLVSSTMINSDPFKNEIDPIEVLTTLDGFIHELKEKPDGDTIERIKQQLAGYQIVTLEYGEQLRWITSPVYLHRETYRNSMMHRIQHLLSSGGNWKHEHGERERIDVVSYPVPINVQITNEVKYGIMSESVVSFTLVIQALHKMFTESLEKGDSLGVFEKPYGITNMNRLKAWIAERETHGKWDVKDTLKTQTLENIVESAGFFVRA